MAESTENITIEGYATVDATGGGTWCRHWRRRLATHNPGMQLLEMRKKYYHPGAFQGDGNRPKWRCHRQWHSGGAIGGSARNIVIRDHATVVATRATGGAAIGHRRCRDSGNNTRKQM
ncbi:MAG: hypothetical protein V8S25_08370 [Faecalibacterium prausnitzii]